VRVARTRNTQGKPEDDESGTTPHSMLHPHNPKAAASQDSEQWKLLKKINEIIKVTGNPAESAQTHSTGLNRRNRWSTEKVAAGSSVYATSSNTTTGNVANAQATARKSAQNVSSLVQVVLLPCRASGNTQSVPGREAAGQHVRLTQECRVSGICKN
jgi:hypothetical protein